MLKDVEMILRIEESANDHLFPFYSGMLAPTVKGYTHPAQNDS